MTDKLSCSVSDCHEVALQVNYAVNIVNDLIMISIDVLVPLDT